MAASEIENFRRQISLKNAFSSLRHRNYRLWFWGQMVSLFGTWMQITAQGFLVYELTRSSAHLGYVGFAAGLPSWFFMPLGGVIADRVQRRTLLMITQTSMMALAFILAALSFLHLVQPWHIVLLAFLLGIANAFDAPARHAFVPDMVGREDLTNAIALNSTIFNSATAIGPAVAGISYALFGPAWCFMINGVSFIAVIAALWRMRLKAGEREVSQASALQDLKEGFRYVLGHPMIRTLISLIVVTSLFGVSFAVLLPAWAVKVLGGDATTNGWLQSARGIGALIGALLIASLGRFDFKGRLLNLGTFAFPLLVLAFSLVRWLPLSLAVLIGTGMAVIFIFNLANALVQTLVRDELRGRVMGLYSLTFFGFLPVGALWIGTMAQRFGETAAVLINAGIMLLLCTAIAISVPELRRLK
ncbi:MAG: MFS transporter [Candidatus Aminicenantes bacterium RBG_19FT_COMBO_58_17]|nr:MAG: MFS transporter [Candidatus Aminicenantes bacterium RBG_19FT_COMBO_58_17]